MRGKINKNFETICIVTLQGMERTARGKHDGGDAAWEEANLGSYKRSEIRLVEVQESLCKEVLRGEDQCHALAETNEALIEEWWFRQQEANDDLHSWLCVDRLQVCCPAGHYGAKCAKCADCGGNGKCKGDGTRKGNGKCACDDGYQGESCNGCDNQHYESYRDDTKLLCSVCHVACGDEGGCTGAGPKGEQIYMRVVRLIKCICIYSQRVACAKVVGQCNQNSAVAWTLTSAPAKKRSANGTSFA